MFCGKRVTETICAPRDFIDQSLRNNLTALDYRHPVANLLHLEQEVAGKKHGTPLSRQVFDKMADFGHTGRVKAVGRLVQYNQVGIG